MKLKAPNRLTPFRRKILARDRALNREYDEFLKLPGQSKTELNKYIMEKYGIHSTETLYKILRTGRRNREEGPQI